VRFDLNRTVKEEFERRAPKPADSVERPDRIGLASGHGHRRKSSGGNRRVEAAPFDLAGETVFAIVTCMAAPKSCAPSRRIDGAREENCITSA